MVTFIATSVVRGAAQGESHGGIYLADFEAERITQPVDWNTMQIDWAGRGWDRGLRGIAFGPDEVYVAASDELFVYDPDFQLKASWRNPYLRHCHEISRRGDMIFLTSTGFDCILGFDVKAEDFVWGLSLTPTGERLGFRSFDPRQKGGPEESNALHLNSVSATENGLFLSGLHTTGLMRYDGKRLSIVASLPQGSHNAQPLGDGIVFNDTGADLLRFVTPSRQLTFQVPHYAPDTLTHTQFGDGRVARQGFARGLCVVSSTLVAGGSSPSTITLHDLAANRSLQTVTLSRDVRNAIHGLEVWPF
jgi:hypothetical protein